MKAMIMTVMLVVVMAAPASAVTLHATDGGISMLQIAFFEPEVGLTGNGWALDGYGTTSAGGTHPSFNFIAAHLTLGGATYTAGEDIARATSNSSMTIDNVFGPCPPPLQPCFAGTFTFTGHIGGFDTAFPGGFDVSGAGWIYTDWLTSIGHLSDGTTVEQPFFRIRYLVPEPSSPALFTVALLGLALIYLVRRRDIVPH